jgi:hypothetical protein
MTPPPGNILQLRQLLAGRFPHVRTGLDPVRTAVCCPTGLPQIDTLLQGGLPKGALTELVGAGTGSGSALLVRALLRHAQENHQWLGLIDGQDSFDPTPLDQEILFRLLWIRCHHASQAIKAADLLLRDGNVPLVLLDLTLNPAAQLKKIPATTWYRFQRILEQASTALLVLTPHALVNGVPARLSLHGRFRLDALAKTEAELLAGLKIELIKSHAHEFAPVAEAG